MWKPMAARLISVLLAAALGAAALEGSSAATRTYFSASRTYTVKLVKAIHTQCSFMYMSAQTCLGGTNQVDFWYLDDGAGNQHWVFTPVPGAPDDIYTISSASRSRVSGCGSQFTAGTSCNSTAISLEVPLPLSGNSSGLSAQAFHLRLFQPQVYQIESVRLRDECNVQATSLATNASLSDDDPCGWSAPTMVSDGAAIYAERGLFLIESVGCKAAPNGYQLHASVLINGPPNVPYYTTEMADSVSAAFNSCNSDPLCIAWDGNGQRTSRTGPLKDDREHLYYDDPDGCTYIKIGDPAPPVRLVYATEPAAGQLMGRVEVSFNAAWGTTCDVGWGDEEARVVCRQLGYPYGYYNRLPRGIYAQNATVDQPIWVSGATCSGAEEHLGQCPAAPAGRDATTTCDHTQDVGVLCSNDDLLVPARLARTTQPAPGVTMGRVEEFVNGMWHTPCDAGWGDEEAKVVCRQLGYTYGYYSRVLDSVSMNQTQAGKGVDAACTGAEQHLGQCFGLPAVVGEHCDQAKGVGVLCSKETMLSMAIPSGGSSTLGCAYNGTGQCLGQDGGISGLHRVAGQAFRVASTVRLTRATFEIAVGTAWSETLYNTTAAEIQFTALLYTTIDRTNDLTNANVIEVVTSAPMAARLNISAISATKEGPGSRVAFAFDVSDARWVLQAGGYYFLGISSDDSVACSVRVLVTEVPTSHPQGCTYPRASFCSAPMMSCSEGHREPRGLLDEPWSTHSDWILHMDVYGALMLGAAWAAGDRSTEEGCKVPFSPTDGAVVNTTVWCYDPWGVVAFRVDCDGDGVLDAACAKQGKEFAASLSTQGCIPTKAELYDTSLCPRVFALESAGLVSLCPDIPSYKVFREMDVQDNGGFNLGFISWWTGDRAFGSVAELAQAAAGLCNSLPTCVGFTSRGYLKMYISSRSRSHVTNNCLYVKAMEYSYSLPVTTLALNKPQELDSGYCTTSDNDCLESPSGNHRLCMQSDGNLVQYHGSTQTWGSSTYYFGQAMAPYKLCLLPDGDLVAYQRDGYPIWASFQSGKGPSVLRVQDNGNVVTYTLGGTPTWATFPEAALVGNWSQAATFQVFELQQDQSVSELPSGYCINNTPGRMMLSPNGHQALNLDPDGNFWQYSVADDVGSPVWPVWKSVLNRGRDKGPYKLCMLDDGNLVGYYGNGQPFWATFQAGNGPSVLNITDDGRLATYRLSDGAATWSSIGGYK